MSFHLRDIEIYLKTGAEFTCERLCGGREFLSNFTLEFKENIIFVFFHGEKKFNLICVVREYEVAGIQH